MDQHKYWGDIMRLIKHFIAVSAVAGMLTIAPFGDSWAGDAETKAIVEHHLAAFGAGDMKDTLSDYTEESVVLTPGGALKGLKAIEGLFGALFAEFSKPGASFELKLLSTSNDVGYIVWSAETADNVYELGTDTYIIEDGKIAVQTFAAKAVPKM
ncbi:MAG: nuclear transport factor 2 family protein [Alphaproteobacteria bacterium]